MLIKEAARIPSIDERRGREVIARIDAILAWSEKSQRQQDSKFAELGEFLCEVRAAQFWRLEGVASFDQFLQRRFPDSRRKAYYLMSIHEQLPPKIRPKLAKIGWSKAIELVKVARRQKTNFDADAWYDRARQLSKQKLRDEVERATTGRSDAGELIWFKVYKTQLPVIEEAIEAAGLMLGSIYSRGYCLEMICADFLAGVATMPERRGQLQKAILQLCSMLDAEQRKEIRNGLEESA